MTVKDLYEKMEERIPMSLREEWDNDGLMCCADKSTEVKKAIVTLDVTEEIIDYAISEGFDLIVSHHPLIFRPIKAINEESHVARKLIKLITSGVSVFSFHTRADKVVGGVNDQLCDLLDIYDSAPFGEGDIGRIGKLDDDYTLEDFVYKLKSALGSDMIKYADGYNKVKTVALVGGDGKDFVLDAIKSGADTYVSGRISYNLMEEAAELGINLIEAGHFFTEQPVTSFFSNILTRLDSELYVEIADSNLIRIM